MRTSSAAETVNVVMAVGSCRVGERGSFALPRVVGGYLRAARRSHTARRGPL
jgi:hypothetical protein